MLKSKNAKKILQSQNKPNLDYLCPTRLQTRVNCLPYEKPAYNNTTFNEAVKALQSFTKVNNITDQVYLDFANFEEHYKFHAGKVENGSNETFKKMEELRWKNIIAPKILKFSKEYKIFEHIFPKKFKTKVQLTCNWQYTKWLGMYGHDVPPNWCLYSPTVNIVTNSPKEKLYTLMMTDLDRPYPKDGILEEWCHWKIVNIPVKERLEIRGGESVFLKSNPDNVNCFNLQTRFPFRPNQEKRKQVGDTIFPYIPPHPAHSNPRLTRRYLFTLIEQKELIDVEKYKNDLKLQSVKEYKKKNTVEELKEMEYVERGLFLPTWKYVTETKSKVVSNFFICFYNFSIRLPVMGLLDQAGIS
ncbi:hypothetical protein HK099_004757 [Clydaea vesicula]|uniref:Uncharacterized protein n=1 Tax=Clydaea vesicula TaxID=447962 RepID=A0AAD5Y018_9FUNG|nr:hypothetical protein HK099_004757 [Clydaea vesicula]